MICYVCNIVLESVWPPLNDEFFDVSLKMWPLRVKSAQRIFEPIEFEHYPPIEPQNSYPKTTKFVPSWSFFPDHCFFLAVTCLFSQPQNSYRKPQKSYRKPQNSYPKTTKFVPPESFFSTPHGWSKSGFFSLYTLPSPMISLKCVHIKSVGSWDVSWNPCGHHSMTSFLTSHRKCGHIHTFQ